MNDSNHNFKSDQKPIARQDHPHIVHHLKKSRYPKYTTPREILNKPSITNYTPENYSKIRSSNYQPKPQAEVEAPKEIVYASAKNSRLSGLLSSILASLTFLLAVFSWVIYFWAKSY